jgi:hypothetical protein
LRRRAPTLLRSGWDARVGTSASSGDSRRRVYGIYPVTPIGGTDRPSSGHVMSRAHARFRGPGVVFMNVRVLLPVLVAATLVGLPAVATRQQVFIATETARGEYENGVFTRSYPQFRFRFEIDETAGRATLTQIARLDLESVVKPGTAYQIVGIDEGAGLRASLASEARRGQRVLTLVGLPLSRSRQKRSSWVNSSSSTARLHLGGCTSPAGQFGSSRRH